MVIVVCEIGKVKLEALNFSAHLQCKYITVQEHQKTKIENKTIYFNHTAITLFYFNKPITQNNI